ncbi:hypothetical protein PG984_003566 [Apiospora sp. TS-2023a]
MYRATRDHQRSLLLLADRRQWCPAVQDEFETLYPCHYSGRTQHLHVAVHPEATPRANQTILQATVSHLAPYNANPEPVTTNGKERLLLIDLETTDPLVKHVLLGDQV